MSVTAAGRTTVRLHRLTMVADSDGVMVGRPDTGSYALFPDEGAQALRMLAAGEPVAEMAEWYERTCGSALDVDDFLETIDELGFVLADGEEEPPVVPVRWQRLGRWTFSWPAWLAYAAVIAAAVTAMVHNSTLRPGYRNIFFTEHISLIPLALTGFTIPCILVHESFHALAGRRLGLPSTLGVGRRLYFLVAETRLDSLLSVRRRQRYLPFVAGMLADLIVISLLTLLAAALLNTGLPHWCSALCLTVAFSCVLRVIWQFLFYLETDLYYVASTALHCSDLQNATRYHVRSQFRRLLRRPPIPPDADWSPHDRAVARWYSVVLVAGYGFSLGSLTWAGIPTAVRLWSTVIHRLTAPGVRFSDVLDALIFITVELGSMGMLAYITLRDRRNRARRTSSEGART